MIERLAVIGFGDLEVSPHVAASIANFFGERHLEIRCWGPNKEMCDVMCRVLREFLRSQQLRHRVFSMTLDEAVFQPGGVVLCTEIQPRLPVAPIVPQFRVQSLSTVPGGDDVVKFQALRWINREDWPLPFIQEHSESELTKWLNGL